MNGTGPTCFIPTSISYWGTVGPNEGIGRAGVISHAAIVARENGLPTVVGVPEVTRRIRDGQRVRVDGTSGIVEILE
jgi:predicted aconitase with swiveling domain